MRSLSPKSKVFANIALHTLVWGFWFAAPFLFSFNDPQRNEPPKNPNFYFFIWIPMLFSLMLFYLNYFLLIEKLLFNKKILWFLGVNLVLIIAFAYFSDFIRDLFITPDPNFINKNHLGNNPNLTENFRQKPPKEFLFGLRNLTFFFIVSISVAIRTTSRWLITENQRKNLENENLKSELSNLKMQLNPHFFFNTLNNIYSLIKTSPDKAQESVHGLAKLMRYHLYETNEELVPLSGEVEFLKNYIALMKIRVTSNVTIETEYNIENPTTLIAPLLFIPLVENSFKHGVSPVEESTIKLTMVEQNKILSFEIVNTNFPQKTNGLNESGIGLDNIIKRLALIYPEKHNFVKGYKNNHFFIKVVIQL